MFTAPHRIPSARRLGGGRTAAPASHLGRALTVNGRLNCDGEVRVFGRVVGNISAAKLLIASGGAVEGDVLAQEVCIGGRFSGRIFAVDVTLEASADVQGRVFHHSISVAKGARIDGRMPWRPANFFESLDQLPEEDT